MIWKLTVRSFLITRLFAGIFFMALPGLVPGAGAQSNYFADSLKKDLLQARTDQQRAQDMLSLSRYFARIDTVQAEEYARQAIEMAELSRDRNLMADVYLKNGIRYLNSGELADIDRAMGNFRQAERIARESGLEDKLVETYCDISDGYRSMGDNDKALEYSNLAVASVSGRENDTAKVLAYTSLGDVYAARNEKLLAFRNYLEASDVAELSKSSFLIRDAYSSLSYFYEGIPEYDKAIDYRVKTIDLDRANRNDGRRLDDYNRLGNLFAKEKKYDLALEMYEKSIALADTMHFDLYKVNSYLDIFQMYFKANQFRKGVDYSNQHPALMEIIQKAGLQFIIDEIYGSAYSDMGRFDSAAFYFRRAEPLVEAKMSVLDRSEFYGEVGKFYKKKGDDAGAIAYFLKRRAIGKVVKSLGILQSSDSNLVTLYVRAGDYKSAHLYNSEYVLYTDSIRGMDREADRVKLQVDNDNRRRERLVREEEANTEHRHSVQYMGFTIGLIILFIVLVMLGLFVISPRALRALGFFSFIFLFEFIILLADKQIHEWTHGEPWKILLIKIFLAAVLLPLHHWLEHKVIHYLMSRKKGTLSTGVKEEPAAA